MSMFFEKLVFSTHVKNMLVKLDHLARDRGENEKYSPNGGLKGIYHGESKKSPSKNTSFGRLKKFSHRTTQG